MDPKKILAAAKAAPSKVQIEDHREAVKLLREKGYTWREIADFLNERGIQTDHTRVYRTFGKTPKHRPTETRDVQISKVTYLGIRKSKKNNSWNVMEIELPSKLGQPITVVGYAWGTGDANFALENENEIASQNATLVVKSGDKFPTAYLKVELKVEGDVWMESEVYIMPKWEILL